MSNLFYTRYVGGKRLEVKYVIDMIKKLYEEKEINTIVEPFAGSAAVSLHCKIKHGIHVKYHVNDIDTEHIKFLKYVKKKGTQALYESIKKLWTDNKDHSTEYVKKLQQELKDNPKRYDLQILLKGICYMGENTYYENNSKSRGKFNKDMTETDNFFKAAEITNDDFNTIFEQYRNNKKALLILDPPYLNSSNKDYANKSVDENYNIIDNTKMYIDILNFLKTTKCKVLMFINDNAVNRYLYDGFIKKSYPKAYGRGHLHTSHMIVSNF